MTLDDLEQ